MTIENLSKAYGKKEVLQNIWLSFYPDAKIGVIGGNGSGKSTLLRIMAGMDTDFIGSVRPAAGIRTGYLPQEPMLDPDLDVRGNVEIAVAPTRALLARFEEINAILFKSTLEPVERVLKDAKMAREKVRLLFFLLLVFAHLTLG